MNDIPGNRPEDIDLEKAFDEMLEEINHLGYTPEEVRKIWRYGVSEHTRRAFHESEGDLCLDCNGKGMLYDYDYDDDGCHESVEKCCICKGKGRIVRKG